MLSCRRNICLWEETLRPQVEPEDTSAAGWLRDPQGHSARKPHAITHGPSTLRVTGAVEALFVNERFDRVQHSFADKIDLMAKFDGFRVEAGEHHHKVVDGLCSGENIERDDAGFSHFLVIDIPLFSALRVGQGLIVEPGRRHQFVAEKASMSGGREDRPGGDEDIADPAGDLVNRDLGPDLDPGDQVLVDDRVEDATALNRVGCEK
jgi:hypothetical protein